MTGRPIPAGQHGRMLAILERGHGVSEVTCRDMRLIAEALTDQSRRLASRARSKAYAGQARPSPGDRPCDPAGAG